MASVARASAAAVGLFAFLVMTGNVIKDLLDYVLAGRLPWLTTVELVALLAPFACTYALPMGMLLGVLLVLGRMAAQNEIIAQRAAGLGIGYVARPVLLLAALASLGAVAVNYIYMPKSRVAYHQILADASRRNPLSFIVTKTFMRDFPGVIAYVSRRDGDFLHDIWIWQLNRDKTVRTALRAAQGRVEYDEKENLLRLVLEDVTTEVRDAKNAEDFSKPQPIAQTEVVPIELRLDEIFGASSPHIKMDWLTPAELKARADKIRAVAPEQRTPDQLKELLAIAVTLSSKAATAFAVFPLVLVAIPLAIRVSRKETAANFALALAVVLFYYFLTIVVGWTTRSAALHPEYLVWAPDLIVLAVGVWLYRRVERV